MRGVCEGWHVEMWCILANIPQRCLSTQEPEVRRAMLNVFKIKVIHTYPSYLVALDKHWPQKPGFLFLPALLIIPLSLGPSIAPPMPFTGTVLSLNVPPSFLIITSLAFAAPGLSHPNSWLG